MKIRQARVDSTVSFFQKQLFERYSFEQYHSIEEPALFFGIWQQLDIINKHQGYKIIYLASPTDGQKLHLLTPSEKMFVKDDKILHAEKLIDIPDRYQKKHIIFETKKYDMYQPNTLGTKVYAYIGSESRKRPEFNFVMLERIQSKINFEIIYGMTKPNGEVHSHDFVKSTWYDNCFVNLNFSRYNGLQSMVELAFMGRKTIANFHRDFPSVIRYHDENHIVELINNESIKIGSVQPSINNHTVNDEWLDISWWINE